MPDAENLGRMTGGLLGTLFVIAIIILIIRHLMHKDGVLGDPYVRNRRNQKPATAKVIEYMRSEFSLNPADIDVKLAFYGADGLLYTVLQTLPRGFDMYLHPVGSEMPIKYVFKPNGVPVAILPLK